MKIYDESYDLYVSQIKNKIKNAGTVAKLQNLVGAEEVQGSEAEIVGTHDSIRRSVWSSQRIGSGWFARKQCARLFVDAVARKTTMQPADRTTWPKLQTTDCIAVAVAASYTNLIASNAPRSLSFHRRKFNSCIARPIARENHYDALFSCGSLRGCSTRFLTS